VEQGVAGEAMRVSHQGPRGIKRAVVFHVEHWRGVPGDTPGAECLGVTRGRGRGVEGWSPGALGDQGGGVLGGECTTPNIG